MSCSILGSSIFIISALMKVSMNDELLDIVDENDYVIGQKMRSEVYKKNLRNSRVIYAFLINDAQKIWIPKRSPHKKLFPSCWDASVAGHVTAGESYDEGFVRETQEELNLDVTNVRYRYIGKLTPQQQDVFGFTQLYCIYSNEAPDYNRDDFVEAYWFSLDEIQERLKRGEPAKDDLSKVLNFFRNYLEQR